MVKKLSMFFSSIFLFFLFICAPTKEDSRYDQLPYLINGYYNAGYEHWILRGKDLSIYYSGCELWQEGNASFVIDNWTEDTLIKFDIALQYKWNYNKLNYDTTGKSTLFLEIHEIKPDSFGISRPSIGGGTYLSFFSKGDSIGRAKNNLEWVRYRLDTTSTGVWCRCPE